MTPENLINKLAALVLTHRDREALQLASQSLPQIRPAITIEQVIQITELMHTAQSAVDLEEGDAAHRESKTEAQLSDRS